MKKKHKIKLIRQFAYLISVFIVTTIVFTAIVTYFSQMSEYRKVCRERIMEVGDYLTGLILQDPDDFLSYQKYYAAHYPDIRIPYDFSECVTARKAFDHAFDEA